MDKKPIKAARCKHMPAKDNTVVIFSSKRGNIYEAGFTIGVQDFTVAECETKATAAWYCDVLETAFNTLITPAWIDNLKSQENRQLVMDDLKIKVVNLK